MRPRPSFLSFWLPRFAFLVALIILGWALINIRMLILQARLSAPAGRGASPAVAPTKNRDMDKRPDDFEVLYHWEEGSLPPPYHYEYDLHILPSGMGEISLTPDYPAEGVPVWNETFVVKLEALDELYQLMVAQGLFTEEWQGQDDPPVGGSSDSMTVTAYGKQIEIPPYVLARQEAKFQEMVSALNAWVPKDAWQRLHTQREQYMSEN